MIIKNIKVDELEPFKTATGLTGRFRYRGPRRTIREHQDCSPEVATHGTLYHTNAIIHENGEWRYAKTWSLTGWKGAKPIVRQLEDSKDGSTSHKVRRIER